MLFLAFADTLAASGRAAPSTEACCMVAALGAAFLRQGGFLRFRPRPFCGDGATFSPMGVNSLLIFLSGRMCRRHLNTALRAGAQKFKIFEYWRQGAGTLA